MNSVFDLCMFYSAVASIFVLFCILFNQTSTKTALNSVSYYLCLMLLCHSVAISCYSLVTICFFEYNLESIAHFKLLRAVFGFVMGFFSFSYPYVIFSLIRYFIKGKKPLNGFLGRNTFFLYVVTALLYIIGAYFVTCEYVATDEEHASQYYGFFSITPVVLLIFYVLVIRDLNQVIKDAVTNSFMSNGVRVAILYVIVYLVYVIQLITHERAISLDFLTGLNNRNELQRYLSRLFEKVDSLDQTLNIIFIDINDFKLINDTYGHNYGDKALLSISNCLKKAAFSSNCFICRYAGDEFTVVLKESNLKSVDDYTKALLDNLKQVNCSKEHPFELSISIGKTRFNPKFKNVAEFIEAADRKMYEEKQKYKEEKAKALSDA